MHTFDGLTASIFYGIWIKQSGAMVCIVNLDKVLLKKLFPTMNIEKVRIFNIEKRKCNIVRKRDSGNDLYDCKIQFPADFAKDIYSYDEYFKS